MDFEFKNVSSAILAAYKAYQRKEDLVERKYQLIKSVLDANNIEPESILFMGFDPWILAEWKPKHVFVGCISDDVAEYLDAEGILYTRLYDDEIHNTIPFDVVVAADEFLTYADGNQRDLVDLMSELANELFITTLRDYKNQPPQSRDFSQPTVIKNDDNFSVFLEYHHYEYKIKNHWISYIYENGNTINTYGGFKRQPMFFKQLAKFAYDAGATNFTVHRDLMFKSLVKKSYEHIISVSFK